MKLYDIKNKEYKNKIILFIVPTTCGMHGSIPNLSMYTSLPSCVGTMWACIHGQVR